MFKSFSSLFILLIAIFLSPGILNADDGKIIVSGVISNLEEREGATISISILTNNGEIKTYELKDSTSYGLENIAGERWTGNQLESGKKALVKLREHQSRLAPITIVTDQNFAVEVVDMEKRNVKTNLAYLFACFAIAWVSFFVYLIIINGRMKKAPTK